MERLFTLGFVSVAATTINLGMSATKAIAQTVDFDVTYETEVDFSPLPNTPFSIVSVSGTAASAPFDLTNFETSNYNQLNPATGEFTFNGDPTVFGLDPNDFPVQIDRFFGSGENELFGISGGNGLFDLPGGRVTGEGSIQIIGGSGELQGASGTLFFTEEEVLDPDPTAPSVGTAIVTGTIVVPETVPEPGATATLVGLGLVGFFVRRQSF